LFELLGFFRGFHQNMAGLSFHWGRYLATVVTTGRGIMP
jgi:hypothetical protein